MLEPYSTFHSCFPCKVTVIVNDINDNTPQFVTPPQSTHISEAARPGSNVIQVPAVDKDLGFAGKVVYNITSGNADGTFRVLSPGQTETQVDANFKI